METIETVPQSRSFIRINGEEHNLDALLKLLEKYNIKVKTVFSSDPRPGAEKRITKNFIPALWSQLEVKASYDDVRVAFESSKEFRSHVDKILWIV